ncbi:MAG: protoporphyrinogen oxidase [Cephaloticoccus sp.]|nr:protoporphyrinogen oxidase [Cephaloticoccus sp.]MCF7759832.1 protoporphyrinogen oxidase [Cephaloticoccus sp.]
MSTETSPLPVAVLGGGITGLTAAWHLHRANVPVRVLEAARVPGGVIVSTRDQGWLQESGPNSMLEGSAEVAALIDAVGLNPRRLYAADSAKNRYVMRDGRLVAMPTSPLAFVGTKLFSMRAKLALLGEPWRAKAPADVEESVGAFVERRLGREFLDYAINPFVGGVYAGDPCKLSVTHGFPKLHALEQTYGSLIRGALKRRNTSGGPKGRILSFPEGLAELPQALAAGLGERVQLGQRVTSVRKVAQHWEVTSEKDGRMVTENYAAVVCALPADVLAKLPLVDVPGADRLPELGEIEQPAVTSVFAGYRREQVAHPLDGFGLLVPEIEKRRMLGVLFSSTLFPNRAPDGHVALTTFVGGVRSPELAHLDDAGLHQLLREELGSLLGVQGEPVYYRVTRWPRAIPQYTLGYGRFKAIFSSVEAATPGIYFGGNARDGISLANCIESGRRLARAVRTGMNSPT